MGKVGKLKVEKREALRLAVTGGREYDDIVFVARILKRYQKRAKAEGKVLVVTQGGAQGLDTLVRNWCKKNGVVCLTVDAHWEYYGNPAGPIRNGWVIEFCDPTHGYVFPGNRGTNDMKGKMVDAGLEVDCWEDEE